jgi:hypothetical protein
MGEWFVNRAARIARCRSRDVTRNSAVASRSPKHSTWEGDIMDGDPVRTGCVRSPRGVRWIAAAGLVTAAGALLVAGQLAVPAFAAGAPVGLGTAQSYSVLGGQAVTNTGPSVLGADVGVSPGTAITGFPPGVTGGVMHAADAAAAQAQSDLGIAYDDAAGRAMTAAVSGDLVDKTLPDGVYKSTGSLELSGTMTLDGQGDPSSVFIFQMASTLITASASDVLLINGAQACHVYWQVGSSATLGTASKFKGTILALTSISVTTGAEVVGRALARNGQVSLDTNVFTVPSCDTQPTTTTDVSTTTTSPTTTTDSTTTTTDASTTTTTPTTTTDSTTTTTDESTTTTTPTTTTTDESTTTTTPTTTTDESTTTTTPTTTTDESTTTTTPTTTTDESTTTTTTESTTTTDESTTTESTTSDTTTTTVPTWTTDSSTTDTSTTEGVTTGSTKSAEGQSSWIGGPGPGEYPSGASDLASTGVSSRLGSVLGLGVLLLLAGALLLLINRSRRSRKR